MANDQTDSGTALRSRNLRRTGSGAGTGADRECDFVRLNSVPHLAAIVQPSQTSELDIWLLPRVDPVSGPFNQRSAIRVLFQIDCIFRLRGSVHWAFLWPFRFRLLGTREPPGLLIVLGGF